MHSYYNDLLNFIENNPNWKELLETESYAISVKQCPFVDKFGDLLYPELYMLSYNILFADFSNPIVKACRGCIVSFKDNKANMVCTPFYKFMNYGEDSVDNIDWNSAVVRDKIDGCLIKLFNYKDNWIWVTNNGWNIDTDFSVTVASSFVEKETEHCTTFEQLKDYALNKQCDPKYLYDELSKDYTYMFELISPQNRIICDYPKTELCLLGARNVKTYQEILPEYLISQYKSFENFKIPKILNLSNIDDVISLCNSYHDNFHEGVVVCDNNFKRFKIKCNYYLQLKGFKGNIGFTEQKIYDAILNDSIDDIVGVFPELSERVKEVKNKISKLRTKISYFITLGKNKYNELSLEENPRKIYASWVYSNYSKYYSFLFLALNDSVSITDIIKNLKYKDALKYLEED